MLKYEFKRLVLDRKNIYFFIVILAVSLYFVNSGVQDYRQFQEYKTLFQDAEAKLVTYYADLQQYSGYGFRVLLVPPIFNIFFTNSTVLSDIEGRVANTEIIYIYTPKKGKKLFSSKGYFKDFSGFLYFTGSLLMVYLGAIGFRSMNQLKFKLGFISPGKLFLHSTAARLFWLNLYFIFVMGICFALPFLLRLSDLTEANGQLLAFGLYTLLLLNFFYLFGLLIGVSLSFRPSVFIWMFVLWILFIFLIPETSRLLLSEKAENLPSSLKLDMQKVMEKQVFEQKAGDKYSRVKDNPIEREIFYRSFSNDFIDNVHFLNENREFSMNKQIRETAYFYEKRSLLLPFLYYSFLSGEISGKGYYAYLDFKEYLMETQKDFLRFYFDNYYIIKQAEVNNFVQNEENLFRSHGHLPKTFWWACVVAFYYCGVLASAAYYLLKKQVYAND